MNTDAVTELRQQVSDRLSTLAHLLSQPDLDATRLIAIEGERLAAQSALAMLDARLEPSDDEATDSHPA